jgi:nucleolar complex protein 3
LTAVLLDRSKPTIEKIHRLNKPTPKPLAHDNLPSANSSSVESHDSEPELFDVATKSQASDSEEEDLERHYERTSHLLGRPPERPVVERLPIKLADGRLIQTGVKDLPRAYDIEEYETESSEPSEAEQDGRSLNAGDRFTGTRFGRLAVFDVVSQGSRKRRIEGAKDQIASICQEIVANPENSVRVGRIL